MPSTESTTPATMPPLSECWRDIQGLNDWKNLLDATGGEGVDENLRREIIRYGEFAQVCYDGFEYDEASPQCGNSKFKKQDLLVSVGLPDTGYEITKYIYATSKLLLPGFFKQPQTGEDTWSRHSNWMGFIAVATSEDEVKRLGRRDIVIAWRGTVSRLEWIKNITDILKPSGLDPHDDLTKGIEVEAGFLDVYTAYIPNSRYNHLSARYQVLFEITRLLNLYRKEEMSITVTGHSLGGALALLCGYDLAELGANYSQLSPLTPSPEIKPLSPHLLTPRRNLQNTMATASATSVHNDSTKLKETPDHETKVEAEHKEADLNNASPASSKVDVDVKLEEDKVAVTKGKSKSTLAKETLTVEIKEKGSAPPRIPITVLSFSEPRVGDAEFKARCDELGVKVLRVLNRKDIVPKVPGVFMNEHMWAPMLKTLDLLPWAYVHVGTSFELDSEISPYLREGGGLVEQHNLEGLLHLVDGYQGPNKPFVSSGRRELKLVNKSCDFLKPDLGVPPRWRK